MTIMLKWSIHLGEQMYFDDFVPGTGYIVLLKSDFKSIERFKQYARFMKQDGCDKIYIPIDYGRAVEEKLSQNEL